MLKRYFYFNRGKKKVYKTDIHLYVEANPLTPPKKKTDTENRSVVCEGWGGDGRNR